MGVILYSVNIKGEAEMDDANRQALAGKLRAAFNSAVFLGYQESANHLRDALGQVEPLTYLEQKAAVHSLTAAQLRIDLDRRGGQQKNDAGRLALEDEARRLEETMQQSRKSFRENAAAARKLAVEVVRQPDIATTILAAQKACREEKTPPEIYYKRLPRKSSSAAVLLFRDGKLFVMEPTYKPGLEIPGGMVDKGESFLEAAKRECLEEIGVTPEITRLLCIHYRRGNELTGDSSHHLFLGSIGDQEIRMDYEEIGSFKWLPVPEALAEMAKDRPDLAVRVKAAISVISSGQTAYCEEVQKVLPPTAAPRMAAPKTPPRMG